MITSVTYDIGGAMEKENEVLRHIGKMTTRMAGVDEMLAVILARAVAPDDPKLALAVFAKPFINTKMQYLKEILPDDWIWKKPLLKAIQDVETYRNAAAHSSVHTAFGIMMQTSRTLLRSKGSFAEVNPAEFEPWEARADMLFILLTQISREPLPNFLRGDVRALAASLTGERPAYITAVDHMFPKASTSASPRASTP